MTALDGTPASIVESGTTTETSSGLVFVELSHEFGHYQPVYPGYKDVVIRRVATHATHGVLTSHLVSVMHHGTHVNAPIHLAQRGLGVGQLPLDTFFGNGVVLSIPKGEWEYIEAADVEAAGAEVEAGDIVVINTGWHHSYSDSMEYFGHAPGLSAAAAQWFIDRGVTMVGIDTANVDHPLATSLAQSHRGFPPVVVELPRRYKRRTGRDVSADYPEWNPAHRLLAAAGIPTIENVGADVDVVNGARCTFHALPWYWPPGDACIVRFVAILDPTGNYRVESGR
ncbi:MAG: cyclase family protein [Frankia sp.]